MHAAEEKSAEDILSLSTLVKNSAGDILKFFFLFLPENWLWNFKQMVS